MKNILTDDEILLARDIINIAMANASRAFTDMAGEDFKIHSVSIQEEVGSKLEIINAEDDDLIVLASTIEGEIHAESFLVLNHEDASELSILMLTNGMENNQEMREAMLLEIDNILTASVVTQFSNFFDILIYGQVPKAFKMKKREAENLINSKLNNFKLHFSVETNFITHNSKFYPKFIWVFNTHFLSEIKKVKNNPETMNLISKNKGIIEKYILN